MSAVRTDAMVYVRGYCWALLGGGAVTSGPTPHAGDQNVVRRPPPIRKTNPDVGARRSEGLRRHKGEACRRRLCGPSAGAGGSVPPSGSWCSLTEPPGAATPGVRAGGTYISRRGVDPHPGSITKINSRGVDAQWCCDREGPRSCGFRGVGQRAPHRMTSDPPPPSRDEYGWCGSWLWRQVR